MKAMSVKKKERKKGRTTRWGMRVKEDEKRVVQRVNTKEGETGRGGRDVERKRYH